MNTLSNNKLIDAVGAVTGLAGAALVAAIAIPADPLGRLIGALLGASFLLGAVGAIVREALKRGEQRFPALRKPRVEIATVLPTPRLVDATACELDGEPYPAFASVVSLTEAQLARQRSQRREQRPALEKA